MYNRKVFLVASGFGGMYLSSSYESDKSIKLEQRQMLPLREIGKDWGREMNKKKKITQRPSKFE